MCRSLVLLKEDTLRTNTKSYNKNSTTNKFFAPPLYKPQHVKTLETSTLLQTFTALKSPVICVKSILHLFEVTHRVIIHPPSISYAVTQQPIIITTITHQQRLYQLTWYVSVFYIYITHTYIQDSSGRRNLPTSI